jgi:hypothetical protein
MVMVGGATFWGWGWAVVGLVLWCGVVQVQAVKLSLTKQFQCVFLTRYSSPSIPFPIIQWIAIFFLSRKKEGGKIGV